MRYARCESRVLDANHHTLLFGTEQDNAQIGIVSRSTWLRWSAQNRAVLEYLSSMCHPLQSSSCPSVYSTSQAQKSSNFKFCRHSPESYLERRIAVARKQQLYDGCRCDILFSTYTPLDLTRWTVSASADSVCCAVSLMHYVGRIHAGYRQYTIVSLSRMVSE